MSYLTTPEESPLYEPERDHWGYLPNYARVFALRPEAYAGWKQLAGAIRGGLDQRRYELVTLAAAARLGSRYCSLAHGAILSDRFYDDAAVEAIVADHHRAGLDPVDVSIMDFATKVAADPATITQADTDALKAHGLSDVDVMDIVLAVCARRFFSGVLHATGAVPDSAFDRLDPALYAALAQGT